ncbi:hypothetical protein D9611_005247 [Ephemerocybe angulata]|uniref:Uncharacterized protein n=1 Tax=Ephemerocybe angulata TaxID=980116 RepID=A0A8H5C003_9AGAR|nr:hypothetical protein D9611_005247 [Tulosesus angulatus]
MPAGLPHRPVALGTPPALVTSSSCRARPSDRPAPAFPSRWTCPRRGRVYGTTRCSPHPGPIVASRTVQQPAPTCHTRVQRRRGCPTAFYHVPLASNDAEDLLTPPTTPPALHQLAKRVYPLPNASNDVAFGQCQMRPTTWHPSSESLASNDATGLALPPTTSGHPSLSTPCTSNDLEQPHLDSIPGTSRPTTQKRSPPRPTTPKTPTTTMSPPRPTAPKTS